ncbi:MAG: ATP-binding cassette domain-containing protein [Alphaproteobacteria bacterium]|nr:ATP-binding cassette domain-containing protein [Alphaproteobacteria bacterium]
MNTKTRPASSLMASISNVVSLVDKRQYGLFALMIAVLVMSAGITLGFGLLLKGLVDKGFTNNDISHLNHTLYIMLGMIVMLALGSFARLAISGWLSEKIVSGLRIRAYAHLLTLDPSFYQRRNSAEISSALSADMTTISTVVASSLPLVVRHSLMAVGGLTMLVATSPQLTLLVLVALPLVGIPVVLIGRIVRKRSKLAQEHAGTLGGMVGESLSAIQTVQSYTAEGTFLGRYVAQSSVAGQAAMRQVFSRSAMVASIIFILFTALCAVMWVGAHDVMQGEMSAGALTSFVFYAGIVASAFSVLGDMGAAVFRAAAALDRVNGLLAEETAIASGANAKPVNGSIAFENVVFRYNEAVKAAALDGLTLNIRMGETVAIVGDSGAGKTTVFQLLMRFYDATSGRITLDGQDIKTLDLAHLRRAIAYVPQDSALFSGSVRENILLGKPDATPDMVEAAARQAMAHDFIMALPQGYETPLGERGMRLSGGQKQRIALARALLKSAPVLLLDEATAALDSNNEKSIQDAVQALHGKRTVVIIAHRLSTIMYADRIYVMHAGKVAEAGTHAELLAKGGLYARMVAQQFAVAEDKARREYPDLTGSIQ